MVKGFHHVQRPERKSRAQSLAIDPLLAYAQYEGRLRLLAPGLKRLWPPGYWTGRVVAAAASPVIGIKREGVSDQKERFL